MAIASQNLVLFLHCDLAVNILWFWVDFVNFSLHQNLVC